MSQFVNVIEFTLKYIGEKDEVKIKDEALKIAFMYREETQNKSEKEVQSWIDQWIALFPEDITTGGRPLQSSVDQCFDKMVKFIKRTKYDRDMIFKATESYLEERGLNNFAYTKSAQYFIDKRGEGSLLEDWCKKVKTGEADELLQEANDEYDNNFV